MPDPSMVSHEQTQRPSLRWDAAQRACRDNDLASLKLLIDKGGLFQNLPALQAACRSGAWGRGTASDRESQEFTTQDSIRLSHLLQIATTRGHVNLISYLLEIFPAKDLHVLEWEVVVNAIASGRTDVLEPFLEVDPGLVNMCDFSGKGFGTCFTILFDLVSDEAKHMPIVRLLCDHGADIKEMPSVLEEAKRASTPEVVNYLQGKLNVPNQ